MLSAGGAGSYLWSCRFWPLHDCPSKEICQSFENSNEHARNATNSRANYSWICVFLFVVTRLWKRNSFFVIVYLLLVFLATVQRLGTTFLYILDLCTVLLCIMSRTWVWWLCYRKHKRSRCQQPLDLGNGFKVAAFDLPFRSISVSETIKIDGMKDQLYFRLVEQSILNMQVTSFGLRFSQLSVEPNYAQIITIF